MRLPGSSTTDDPREAYLHKLGAAVGMEKTILKVLPRLTEEANDPTLKQTLEQHRLETEGHVRNLEQVFRTLGADPDEQACPPMAGLATEGEKNLKMVGERLKDQVIQFAVCETEAHEIAVYEGLIMRAEAMGEDDAAILLRENLEQERNALQTARKAADRLVRPAFQNA
jgi:ferritin-like metal-binding protein YciE